LELKIYWTHFAENELQEIFDYYKERASSGIARRLIAGIVRETLKLKNQPLIGQKEELLAKGEQEFHYLIYKNYKIIYWVNVSKHRIEITDVFDSRQNPIKIKRTE